MNKLSNSFKGDTVFDLVYENVPESSMLIKASHEKVAVQLNALGFHFLGMSISNKNVNIDLSELKSTQNKTYLLASDLQKQIVKQLPSSMQLVGVNSDTLFFDIQKISTKKVPVKSKAEISYVQNYALEGKLILEPDSIEVVGPSNQVDTLFSVTTEKLDLVNVSDDFSKEINLHFSDKLTHSTFSASTVNVSGKVSKFSEKKIVLHIEAINLPKNKTVKLFPETLEVLCLGSLDILKKLKVSDFKVVADYAKIDSKNQRRIPVVLRKKPKNLYAVTIDKKDVEFILIQK